MTRTTIPSDLDVVEATHHWVLRFSSVVDKVRPHIESGDWTWAMRLVAHQVSLIQHLRDEGLDDKTLVALHDRFPPVAHPGWSALLEGVEFWSAHQLGLLLRREPNHRVSPLFVPFPSSRLTLELQLPETPAELITRGVVLPERGLCNV